MLFFTWGFIGGKGEKGLEVDPHSVCGKRNWVAIWLFSINKEFKSLSNVSLKISNFIF